MSDVEATFDPIEMDPEETEMAGSFSMLAIEDDVRTSRYTPSHYSLWYLDENKARPVIVYPMRTNVCLRAPSALLSILTMLSRCWSGQGAIKTHHFQ